MGELSARDTLYNEVLKTVKKHGVGMLMNISWRIKITIQGIPKETK